MNFIDALKVIDFVFQNYKTDYPKWYRRIDGTPILNDLSARLADAFSQATSPSPGDVTRQPGLDSVVTDVNEAVDNITGISDVLLLRAVAQDAPDIHPTVRAQLRLIADKLSLKETGT